MGPDGFGFFHHCWLLLKHDLMEVVHEFFLGFSLPMYHTSSFIILTPNVPNSTSFDKFIPISLCLVVYKICSKLLVGRLTLVLSHLIYGIRCLFSGEKYF